MSKVEVTGDNHSFSVNTKRNSKGYSKMANMRIIQKQLVYVIGLSANLAFKEVITLLNIGTFQFLVLRPIWKDFETYREQEQSL